MKTIPCVAWLAVPALIFCCAACQKSEPLPATPPSAVALPEEALFARADSFKNALRFDSATVLYGQVELVFSEKKNWEKLVACRSGAAWCRWFDHDSESALRICKTTLPLAIERLGANHLEVAHLYIVLGNIHADRRTGGSMRQALAWFEKARGIFRQHYREQDPALAEIYDRLAMAHRLGEDHTRAILYADSALTFLDPPRADNALIWCRLYNNLGLNYEDLGRSARALEYFQKARDLWLGLGQPEDSRLAKYLKNIAQAQLGVGDPATALLTNEEALALETRVGEPGGKLLAFVQESIGDCHLAQGDTAAASAIFRHCLETFWPTGPPDNRNGRAALLYKIGQCALAQNDPGAAIHAFRESAALADARHFEADNFNRVQPLLGLGDAQAQAGSYSNAEQSWKQALHIAQAVMGPRHPAVCEIQARMARHCLQTGRLEEALTWTRSAQNACLLPQAPTREGQTPAFDALGKPMEYLNLLSLAAQIRVRQFEFSPGNPGLLDEAMLSYRLAFAFSDSLKILLFTDPARQELQKQVAGIAEKALECLYRKKQVASSDSLTAEAFGIMEKSKCAMLAADLRESAAQAACRLPPDLREKELALKARCMQCRTFLANAGYAPTDPERVAEVRRESDQARHDLDDLIAQLRRHYPDYFQKKYGGPIATLGETQALMTRTKSTFVAYFWGAEGLYATWVGPQSAQWSRLGTSADITPALRALRSTLETCDFLNQTDAARKVAFGKFCQNAAQLHARLLAPLLVAQDTTPLILVTDGPLGFLPFHILLTALPANMGSLDYRALPYLLRQRPVQYEFSATTLLAPRQEKARAGSAYLGFAPDYRQAQPLALAHHRGDQLFWTAPFAGSRAGFAALRYNKPEVADCAAITGGRALLSEQASKKNFTTLAADAGILHLAMHTQSRNDDPMASALVFTAAEGEPVADYQLSLYELDEMRLNAQLTVLNACNTGVGTIQKGEGVMSMARAFRHAGCPAVVTSLWPVEDETGKEVVVRFFKNLQQGEDKSGALRHAALSFLAETKSDAATHPGYWASLVLIGDATPLSAGGPAVPWPAIALGLGVLGLSGWAIWYFWKRWNPVFKARATNSNPAVTPLHPL